MFGWRLLGEPIGAALALGSVGAVLATTAATAAIDDPDVWWIAMAGRDLFASGHVARVNGHAFAAMSTPWIMHEWLLGPLYDLGLRAEGPAFFALIALFSLAAALAVALVATLPNAKNLGASTLLALVTFTCCSKRFLSARPTSIALVLAMLVAALAFAPRFDRKRAVLVVLVVLLWANVHGSFPLGLVLLAAGAWAEPSARSLRIGATIAAFGATFVNPYGARLYGLVAKYLFGDHGGIFDFVHGRIAEFRPLWADRFTTVREPELVALVVFATLALVFLVRGDRSSRVRAIVALALFGLAVKNVRHVEQFGLVTFVLLGGRVGSEAADAPRMTVKMALFAIVPGVAIALAAHVAMLHRDDGWVADSLGGPAIVRLARALPDGAKVHAPFGSSALVLWFAAERGVTVSFDPRNDCYPVRVAELADRADDGDVTALDELGANVVIAPKTADVAIAVNASGWTFTKSDHGWGVYEKPTVE